MKLPPFTLVYRPGQADFSRSPQARRLMAELDEHVQGIGSSLRDVSPAIRGALLATAQLAGGPAGSAKQVAQAVGELRRQEKVEKVGFWDLSAQVGELPRVIAALNKAQPVFTFFEVQAAIPSGLISRPERVVAWVEGSLQKSLTTEEREVIGSNVIFEDFASRARQIRTDLGLDHLLGIVPAMIAFEEDGSLYWNYFSMSEPGLVLASTFDVFRFAQKARRPFEAAVAGIAVSTLLVLLNPRLRFHDAVRGCFFDFNEERHTIVKALRRPHIEKSCLAMIEPHYRGAAEAMTKALRDLAPRRLTKAAASARPPVTARGTSEKPDGSRPKKAAAAAAKRPKAAAKSAAKSAAKRPRAAAKRR